jgi:ribose transport system permease protein
LSQQAQQQAERAVTAPASSTQSRTDLRRWLVRLAPVLGLAIVIVAFAIVNPAPEQYLSVRNLRIVLAQTVIVALASIGMTMIIVSGGIDLSVGSTIALSGVVTAVLLRGGSAPLVAVAAGVLVGGAIGIINGLVITRLKVMPFIATLGMLGVARGVAKWMADQQTVNVPPTWINELAVTFPTASWLIVAPGVWLTALLAVAAAIMLRNTVFGRRVFAIGSNEGAARACGVPTDRLKVWIYGLAGLLFGLSGVTQMSRLRQGDPTVAIGTDWRADDGVPAQRQPADGMADVHPGDHDRHHHRARRRHRSRAPHALQCIADRIVCSVQ